MKRRAWFSMAIVATLLATGSVFGVSAESYSHYSDREVREIGWGNGYDMGYIEGRRDWQYRARFDFKHNRAYDNGKIGYRNEYGHEGTYRKGFREGFESGYSDGFYGRPRRDSGWRNRSRDRWPDSRRDRFPYDRRY